MKNFKIRKLFLLLFLAFALFSVYVLVPLLRPYIAIIGIVLSILCLVIGGLLSEKIRAGSVIFLMLTVLISSCSILYAKNVSARNEDPLSYVDGETHKIKAKITKVSYIGAYSSSYHVDVTGIDGKAADFSAALEIDGVSAFEYGDMISFDATFSEASEETVYLKGKSIFVCAETQTVEFRKRGEKDLAYYLYTTNEYLSKRMVNILGEEVGGFCAALILGNRTYVSKGLRLDFSRVGISHLLALSGLHLSIVAQTLDFLLKNFVKKRYRNIILIVSCWGFALFTGLSVSVVRAAIMLTAVFLADIVGEQNDSLTSLMIAVFCIALFNPNAVYDVGFWFSVSATLGIILVRPATDALFYKWKKPLKNKFLRAFHSVCKYFYGILTMSLAAFFFTLPVSYCAFGEISVVGILSNFVFLPLATILLVLCIFFVPFSYVPYASDVVTFLCKNVAKVVIALAERISDIHGVSASLNYPFAIYIFAGLAVCLVLCIFVNKLTLTKLGALALAFCAAFFSCWGIYSHITKNDVNVAISTIKSGEFVSFEDDGETYVIDVSTGKYSFMYEGLLSIKDFACTEVDNLVLTHYHNYHKNSIERLSDVIKIGNILLPEPETETEEELYSQLVAMLQKLEIPFLTYERGTVYASGNVSIDFAPLYKISRSTKPIIAFKANINGSTFSYIESASFEGIYDYENYFNSDVVFVGSHGPSRKFRVSAEQLYVAEHVIFVESNEEYFRDTEGIENIYYIGEDDGVLRILYKN